MPSHFSRRNFIKSTAAFAGGIAASGKLNSAQAATSKPGTLVSSKELSVPAPGTKHIYLYATDGYLTLPDSKRVYIFGFVGNNPPTSPIANPYSLLGKAQLPAPIIDVVQGDDVYLHLREIGNINRKAPMDGHTIHLHGIHTSAQNDGFPETSFLVRGQEAIYYFKPEHAGTHMYHCHVEASEHVQMGMYGALIVRPQVNSSNTVYGGINVNGQLADQFDKEYVMLLSDLDSRWHRAVELGGISYRDFNPVDFRPDYWLLNGRSFPDTILPAQNEFTGNIGGPPPGYDTYVRVGTGERFLLRMINMGYQTVPWHVHGWHFVIAGKDASPLFVQTPMGDLHEDYTVTIGSGETYDLIIEASNRFDIYGEKSPQGVPYVSIPKAGGGTHTYDGTPATFFPQFYPMHNHDDYKVTNNGIYPGGQLTLIQADAP
jgi:FtsP/CotA-like multicopper oxidase with cupredoxin domain